MKSYPSTNRIEEIRNQHEPYCPLFDQVAQLASHATLLPLLGFDPPLDLFLSLSVPELLLEFSAPPSVSPRGWLTSGFAGLTSRGLFVSYRDDILALDIGSVLHVNNIVGCHRI